LSKWISKNKPKLVVEIGSGQGICSGKIDLRKKKYIGIEPSKILVRRSRKLYKNKNTKFIVGNAYKLPIANEIADGVFSVNVYFHLKNIRIASKELSRILKQKGKFLIITANPLSYRVWESSYFNYKKNKYKIVGKVKVPVNPMSKNIFYLHTFSKIKNSLIKNGLKIDPIKIFGDLGKRKLFIAISGHKK
jgi:ubiquinone/menaquinone biosynthesis C-methylase UbiE